MLPAAAPSEKSRKASRRRRSATHRSPTANPDLRRAPASRTSWIFSACSARTGRRGPSISSWISAASAIRLPIKRSPATFMSTSGGRSCHISFKFDAPATGGNRHEFCPFYPVAVAWAESRLFAGAPAVRSDLLRAQLDRRLLARRLVTLKPYNFWEVPHEEGLVLH